MTRFTSSSGKTSTSSLKTPRTAPRTSPTSSKASSSKMHELLILIIVLAVLFDLANGWHDAANAIATVVSTKVLSPTTAVVMAASMEILGAFLSTEVAKTIGTGIVAPTGITETVLIAALLSAILWNIMTLFLGLPVSSSHALVGGLIGGAVAFRDISILNIAGILRIFTSLLISPIFGLVIGYGFMKLILYLFGQLSP